MTKNQVIMVLETFGCKYDDGSKYHRMLMREVLAKLRGGTKRDQSHKKRKKR